MSDASNFEDEEGETRPKRATLAQIAAYMWARWRARPLLALGFFSLFGVSVVCDLSLPLVSGRLVTALGEGPQAGREGVTLAYGVFAAVALFLYLCRNLSVRFWIPFAARNMKDIVNSAFQDVQRFSTDWHANSYAGATVRRVSRAMWAYDTISDTIAWFILPAAVVLVGVTVLTFLQWPVIGLFVGAAILGFVGSSLLFARYYLAPDYAAANAADTRIGAALADAIGANATVKAFGAEAREESRFGEVIEDWRRKSERLWHRGTDAWLVQNVFLFLLQAGLVGLVVWKWSQGEATAGDAAFAITSFFLVSGYLRTFGENVQTLQKGLADIQDVVAYARQEAEIFDPEEKRAFKPGLGEVRFEQVCFQYKGQSEPLFENLSLVIYPGETVALVGATGSGKTTFAKLLQRLYDVTAGAVLIDGQDVRSVTQASLRRAIALVPQEPTLFHRSLFENIAYARPEASPSEVEAAARRARAHDFISRLPAGYATEVGERGVKLSGGERQRVAIARAFLANAPILVLDEATSSLDNETERDVQAAMRELQSERTTVVIAHRLSTVREVDRILVFERGQIIEQGSHPDLLNFGGVYARLYRLAGESDLLGVA